jgi:acyl carrier protein
MTDEILQILADYLDIPMAELTPDRTLESLGVDSVDFIEILFEIEERFGVRFSGVVSERRKELQTVADVIRLTSEFSAENASHGEELH